MPSQLPEGKDWPTDNLLKPLRDSGSFHAYVHVPFCEVRCGYCDFNTYTADEVRGVSRASFDQALVQEIEFSQRVLRDSGVLIPELSSVFFGGGTPSLFSPEQLGRVLASLKSGFDISAEAEITVEANPESASDEFLAGARDAGVNRVSFGVQSFDPEVLKTLDRRHDPKGVPARVALAKELGFRVSVDLIFGTPGETLDSWERTVDQALELGTEHISAYSLIVEPGTALARAISKGLIEQPDEDLAAAMYELADRKFSNAGLEWYEVSNWGVPSVHNLAYWRGRNWWGYGPGAHSHIAGNRFWNRKHPASYQQALASASPAQGIEQIDQQTHLEERLLLELRCREGVERSLLTDLQINSAKVADYLARGLLTLTPRERIAPTAAGKLMVDGIVLDLLSR